jgi:hypothetical protein
MAINSAGGHGVNVSFAQHDVIHAPDLDLVAILWPEENPIPDFDTAHV